MSIAAIDAFFLRVSELIGLSPALAALLIGFTLGVMLRSLFSSRRAGGSFESLAQASIMNAASPQASLFRERQSAAADLSRSELLQQIVIDEKQLAEIRQLLKSGNKIGAIKVFREATNLGLAEAKSAVEAIERTLA